MLYGLDDLWPLNKVNLFDNIKDQQILKFVFLLAEIIKKIIFTVFIEF